MSKSDLMHTRGKPSLSSQEDNKSMEIKEKEAARVDEGPSQNPRNPRGSKKMAAKKARRRKRKALTTATSGAATGGRQTEHTAMQTGDGLHEVERVVDTVDLMYRAGQMDGRRYDAAQTYRKSAELLFSGYRCALDMTVTGGGGMASPTAAQVDAAAKLHQASLLLGMIDGIIVALIAGEGLTVVEAAARFHGTDTPTREQTETVGRRFRDALEVLADLWSPMPKQGQLRGDRRFSKDEMSRQADRLGEVVRGTWAHVTRSQVYQKP